MLTLEPVLNLKKVVIVGVFSLLITATQGEARTVRLDDAGGFFSNYPSTNQGALGTCYAHPATALVDEFLFRSQSSVLTFNRASPLASSISEVQLSFPDQDQLSYDHSVKSVRISGIEGGNVALTAAAYLSAGKRLAYSDIESKLSNSALKPSGFSTSDLFGETLDEKFSYCRFSLMGILFPKNSAARVPSEHELMKLSLVNLPACERFEAELERIRFMWVNPPPAFKHLTGFQFSAVNKTSVPNIDAIRYLMIKFQSSYSSFYAVLEAFAHEDAFVRPDQNAYRGMIKRYYFKSGGVSKKGTDPTGYIAEIADPEASQLQEIILKHIDEGHPVGVCLDLNPLETTGSVLEYYLRNKKAAPRRHCLTIMGYRGHGQNVTSSNVFQYLIRNSWRHTSQSRCSNAFKNRSLVECETRIIEGSMPTRTMDTGNFWLKPKGMMEIMHHFGEVTLISP